MKKNLFVILLQENLSRNFVVRLQTYMKQENCMKKLEFAFRQAIELYDLSPEANFKLANLLAQQNRFDESIDIITNLYNKDRKNESLSGYIKTLKLHQERSEIEGKIKSNKLSKLDLLDYMKYIFN